MKHNAKKVVLILMVILSIFSMIGCESKDEKAAKRIVEALQEKYGQEFVVDSIGGGWGTMNTNTLKAIVKPKDDPSITVFVEITKDLKNVFDNYLNQAIAKAAVQPITELANSIWGESRVYVANDTGMTYPEHSDTSMSYEQFLKLYPMNWQLVEVFINCERYIDSNGDMDQQGEIGKYKAFAKKLVDNKYMRSSISFRYITPDAYRRFDEAKNSDKDIFEFFSDEEKEQGKLNLVTANSIDIDEQGQIVTPNEEFLKKFDIWKEKRVKSTKLKGDLND
ncbi:hypothetical protein [Paenibacillus terrigena]|uniref:hypothetical protein n=1 Tax=Paenibacillus terrigena TaxID=369333 RepID=UPI0028D22742|nr:hypothetical protein [Paenibacillus terrigena]